MMMGEPFGFDVMFTIIPMFILFIFAVILGLITKQGLSYAKDRQKPVIPVRAKILAKRTHVWGDNSSTNYFATFELENGERMEMQVPDNRIGYMVEGDQGTLSFQGNLFVSFEKS